MTIELDTVQTRLDIGYPQQRQDWTAAPASYDEHTLRIAGHPVMEDWEQGYMEQLADIATRGGGRVLELGYGMGLSAAAIQARKPDHHVVIECHPDVIAKSLEDQRSNYEAGRFHVLSGFWQDVTPMLAAESFDGILFDTYPLEPHEVHRNHFAFFAEARRLLAPGGHFTYYSDEAESLARDHREALEAAGFGQDEIDYLVCEVSPPDGCEYWVARTIVAPIVTKQS